MATMVYLDSRTTGISSKSLALLNYIVYQGGLSANIPPTLGAVAKWIGVHRTTVSSELRELIDRGYLEKVNVHIEDGAVELRLRFNGSDLRHKQIAHDDILDLLITSMYSKMSITNRSQRLSPVNTLFLTLLLAYACPEGYVDQLTQTDMKQRLGFTDAQLKSQMRKLRKLGLLQNLVRGGAFRGLSGRVKSRLRLDLELLTQFVRSTSLPKQSSPKAVKSKVEIISLETVRYIPDLFEANLQDSNGLCRAAPPLEPMKVYEDVVHEFISKNRFQRQRYYRYLTELCTSYAMTGLEKIGPHLTSLRVLAYEQQEEALDNEAILKDFNNTIVDSLKRDLNFDRVAPPISKSNEGQGEDLKPDDCKKTESKLHDEFHKQKAAFIETLRRLTWAILLDPSLAQYVEQAMQPGYRMQLKLYKLEMADFIIISNHLDEPV